MERILFGKVLHGLNLKQALYLLNENNYNKTLHQFRNGFIELKNEDCKFEGEFEKYQKINLNNDEDVTDYTIIRFKENYYNINSININLVNDVLGFAEFNDENDFDEADYNYDP